MRKGIGKKDKTVNTPGRPFMPAMLTHYTYTLLIHSKLENPKAER